MINGVKNSVNFTSSPKKALELGRGAQNVLKKVSGFSSVQQKLALGTCAFLIQPVIDLNNKDIDKNTRELSAVRSASKAVIGTATGIVIRSYCIKFAEKAMAKKDEAGKVLRDTLGKVEIDPKKVVKIFGKMDEKAVQNVPPVLGTFMALGIMMFTNFLIDAPLTNFAMNKISKFMGEKKAEQEVKNG